MACSLSVLDLQYQIQALENYCVAWELGEVSFSFLTCLKFDDFFFLAEHNVD